MGNLLKKITKTQIATIILLITYSVWEYRVFLWAKTLPEGDPIIRVDLIIIYPILLIFIVISLIQLFKKNKL